jgi:hypothetical protein
MKIQINELDEIFRKAAEGYRVEIKPTDWDDMNRRLNQMEKISKNVMVDKFIDLANEFTNTEAKERVCAAFMFAAAQYNAFEAFSKSSNLVRDEEDAIN